MHLYSRIGGKHGIMRLFLYSTATVIPVFLSGIFYSKFTPGIAMLVAAAAFTFVFAYTKWFSLLLPAITFVLIWLKSGLAAALVSHEFLPIALVLAIALTNKRSFNEAVVYTLSVQILFKAAYIVANSIMTIGSFSISEYFSSISSEIDTLVEQIVGVLPTANTSLLNSNSLAIIFKYLFCASYIAYHAVAIYALCYIVRLLSHISSDKALPVSGAQSALTTSRITCFVYITSIIVTVFFGVSVGSSLFMWVFVSLFIILSPTFMILGAKCFFNFGRRMPPAPLVIKIIVCICALYYGLVPFLLLYFAYCGVRYSLAFPAC